MTRPPPPPPRARGAGLPPLRRSAGLGLVTAIFLLVVLSGMAVAMVTLSTTQNTSVALDVQGARAYQAARAGIEYGVYQALRLNSCPGNAAPRSFALPAGSSLGTFSVTVTCNAVANGAVVVSQVTASACNRPNPAGACPNPSNDPDYVQRVLNVQF
jgi:MSHA biogenesis protein MshP